MTTYLNAEPDVPRLEIGATWTAASAQRTGVNAESKLLLLTHAFEVLGCLAVEFRTHWHNQQSRAAIARLGAKQDGVLRNHRRLPDGSLRDTVVFSILDTEWPAVRNGLRHRLARRARLIPRRWSQTAIPAPGSTRPRTSNDRSVCCSREARPPDSSLRRGARTSST